IRNPADRQREYSSLSADMVYPFPQASRDIASLAIWGSHKVAASFSSQPCSSGACIGGLMTGAIWNVVNGECRLMALCDIARARIDVRFRANRTLSGYRR